MGHFSLHCRQFFFGSVLLRITDVVSRHAEGHAFKQIGTRTLAQAGDAPLRQPRTQPPDRCHRWSGRYAVGSCEAADFLDVGVFLAAREFRVAVVFAHEQHRQPPQCGEIERLVKGACARGAVAEKHHADVYAYPALAPPTRRRPRAPGCRRRRQWHPARREPHRPSASSRRAPAQTRGAPEDLGKRRLQIAPLGEHVAMAAMAGKENILAALAARRPRPRLPPVRSTGAESQGFRPCQRAAAPGFRIGESGRVRSTCASSLPGWVPSRTCLAAFRLLPPHETIGAGRLIIPMFPGY